MPAPTEFFGWEWLRRDGLPLRLPPPAAPARRPHGFTLVELLVAIAIVATLAAIALPSYADHVRRARITEAVVRLVDHRARMEQYFLDHRRYDDGTGNCGYPAPLPARADGFAIGCTASAAAYLITATGRDEWGMRGFVYTIDDADARRTPSVPDGWVGNDACWVLRRDGSCV